MTSLLTPNPAAFLGSTLPCTSCWSLPPQKYQCSFQCVETGIRGARRGLWLCADLAQGSWSSSVQRASGRNLGSVLGGGENWEMREWVQMSGKAALTLDHVLSSDQCPASDMDGNNMASMASSNGAGQGGRWMES